MKAHLLKAQELSKHLEKKLLGWTLIEGRIKRKWVFRNFIEAFGFITQVALLAESMGHHPDWSNSYGTVTIELTTHDLEGVSNLDIDLAEAINLLRLNRTT